MLAFGIPFMCLADITFSHTLMVNAYGAMKLLACHPELPLVILSEAKDLVTPCARFFADAQNDKWGK
jgi:hypothetical protein